MIEIDFDLFKRFAQSYSLKETGEVLGVSPQAAHKRLNNIENIRWREVIAICNHIGRKPEFFYKEN